jgi:hypothetical protein
MPTRRTPLNRQRDGLVITQKMLNAFRAFCDAPHEVRWREPHNRLMDLITDKPFPYPIVLPPEQPFEDRAGFAEARANFDALMAALEAEDAKNEGKLKQQRETRKRKQKLKARAKK